jgi:serine/threonine-protein kinase
MLTGKRLFYGETDYQTVELVRNAKIPPIKPQNPQVEPELEDIVRKALAKRKEDRFQSPTDMQDALAQYSYSRGLKVISRDIAELVRQCLDDRAAQSSDGKKPSIIDHMLQEEIVKITSVDFEDPGARPLSAADLSPQGGHGQGDDRPSVVDDGDFIDPRAWSEERLTPVVGIKVVDELERRSTVKDVPTNAPTNAPTTMAAQAAQARKSGRHPSTMSASAAVDAALDDAVRGGPTPGPEALASVLEPSIVTVGRPPEKKAGRSFLLGAVIGVVLLGGAVAALVARKNVAAPQAHGTQPTP